MSESKPKNLREQLPPDLQAVVEYVGSTVKPSDLDSLERYSNIENKSAKLTTLLKAWETQQTEERNLRRTFAKWILIGLLGQMLLVNVAFFLIGFGAIKVDKWVSTSFILAVLAEIVGMANVVIKYLFPRESAEVLKLIEKL